MARRLVTEVVFLVFFVCPYVATASRQSADILSGIFVVKDFCGEYACGNHPAKGYPCHDAARHPQKRFLSY